MLKVGITKFPDTLILSKHFLNKTSFAQNHNLCLHNDFKLSNKRLKSIFQAVEENDINLSFSNISLKGRINNALNKIAHYFLPCYFNSESNQYIAVRLIYTHIKQSHPHKRAHQTTKTIMNIAQMCKDPDKFIHSVSFTPSKTLDSQKLYNASTGLA